MLCPSAFEGSVRRRYEGRLYFALQLDPPIPPKYKVNSLHFPCIWFGLAWIQLGLAWFNLAASGPGAAFDRLGQKRRRACAQAPHARICMRRVLDFELESNENQPMMANAERAAGRG